MCNSLDGAMHKSWLHCLVARIPCWMGIGNITFVLTILFVNTHSVHVTGLLSGGVTVIRRVTWSQMKCSHSRGMGSALVGILPTRWCLGIKKSPTVSVATHCSNS